MNRKHARIDQVADRDAVQRRHAAAVETRRTLQGLPQFQTDEDLPNRLRKLLRKLERCEGQAR